MRVVAIDPGQHTHGVVLADCSGDLPVPEVVCDAASTERVRVLIGMADRVVIERVELYGNERHVGAGGGLMIRFVTDDGEEGDSIDVCCSTAYMRALAAAIIQHADEIDEKGR